MDRDQRAIDMETILGYLGRGNGYPPAPEGPRMWGGFEWAVVRMLGLSVVEHGWSAEEHVLYGSPMEDTPIYWAVLNGNYEH